MTVTITKFKLALSIVVVALVGATAAWAADNPFDDVPNPGDPDEAFFSEPVEWLWHNSLTTGSPAGSNTFKPFDNVTRGEYATFNFRYDENVVQPALTALQGEADAAIESNDTDIANLPDVYFVEVDADGSWMNGSFGTSSTMTSTGNYEVTFPVDDVNDCTWSATLAQKGEFGTFDTAGGEIYLQSDIDFAGFFVRDIDSIFVNTSDSTGTLADRAFHVQITCGLPTLIFIPPIIPPIITLGE